MRVGIVGYGNMGSAFARAIANKVGAQNVVVYDKEEEKRKQAQANGFAVAKDLYFLTSTSELFLIAVKPKDVKNLLEETVKNLKDKIVVSIAAGLEMQFYEKLLGRKSKLVRLMPNINLMVGKGTVAMTHNGNLSQEELNNLKDMLSGCGALYEIPEDMFDSFTAIAGSGPAFIFSFIDALTMAGVREGFSYEQSLSIVLDTLTGSASLVKELGGNPNHWITKVASPSGTTIEGLAYLERKGFKGTVMRCIEKTSEKAKKLKG